MFKNIGSKIRIMATIFTWLGIIASVVMAIIFFWRAYYYNTHAGLRVYSIYFETYINSAFIESSILGFLHLFLGPLVSYYVNCLICGFGELINNTKKSK